MTQILLIGLGAGATAALLFASVTSGVILSIALFYLAPLPIMIAALGWSHWAGLAAALVAGLLLGIAFGPFFLATFLSTIGGPAWWLGYLALLGRPIANGGGEQIEWYPAGRLVLWAAAFGAALVTIGLVTFGTDEDTIRTGLKDAIEHLLRRQSGSAADSPVKLPGFQDTDRLIDLFVVILPPAAAMIAAMTQTANLWLAGRIVKLSGRLARPWPDLTTLSFPPMAAVLFAGAIGVASFVPDVLGLIASLFAATLMLAFAAVGLAALHAMTRRFRGRSAILFGTYGLIAIQGWPLLIMTLLGLAETVFGLRARLASPPAAGT